MPQWGIEPHERASFAGWRPSFWPPSADAPCKYAYMSGGYRIRPYANQKFGPGGVRRREVKKREEKRSTPAFFSFFTSRPQLWGSKGRALGGAQRAPPVCCANSLVRLFAPLGRTLLAPRFRCAQPWPLARNPAIPLAGVRCLGTARLFSLPFLVTKKEGLTGEAFYQKALPQGRQGR